VIERWLDRLVMAWIGAAVFIMIVPVLLFIVALKVADWLDGFCDRNQA